MVRRIVNTSRTLPIIDPQVLVDALMAEGLTVEEVRQEVPCRHISQETFVAALRAEGFDVEEVGARYPHLHEGHAWHLYRASRGK